MGNPLMCCTCSETGSCEWCRLHRTRAESLAMILYCAARSQEKICEVIKYIAGVQHAHSGLEEIAEILMCAGHDLERDARSLLVGIRKHEAAGNYSQESKEKATPQ